MALKQTITTATVQLKREMAWATQRARLLASLAGIPRAVARELGKAIQELLAQLRAHGAPITINFVLFHDDDQQALEIELQQQLDTSHDYQFDAERWSHLLEDTRERLRPTDCQVTATLPNKSDATTAGRADVLISLRRLLSPDDPITPEVATQWSTVLASGSADSALAESQRRLAKLATSLNSANARGAQLEQELASVNKLNETLELLALVASKTDNGIAILDEYGVIEWVNDSFQRLTGRQLPEAMGKLLPEAVFADAEGSPEDTRLLAEAHSQFSDAIRDRVSLQQDLTRMVTSANGTDEQVWLSVNATPVFDDQGIVTRWIAMVRDVTQQRLHEQQLSQAKQRAEHASRVKGDFLANISHEIRTPMNAIVGMIDLLLETELNSRQQEYAGIAREASGTLLQLLNDVLDLSKIESGQLNIHEVEFSLSETVRSAVAPFQANALRAGISLNSKISSEVYDQLIGDPVRLRQILMNLISNAVKFTEHGAVELDVSMTSTMESATTLRFEVSDTGIGIPTEYVETVFQPFEQLDQQQAVQGTGLGLAICRQLAHLLNGSLWAESVPGHGSRFILEAPFGIAEATDEAEAPITMPLAEVKTYADNSEALRILVADDHPANRLLLRRILEKCNHIVHEASDGIEAIKLAEEHEFQLALLDIRMPNLDGTKASEKLRQLYSQRSIPVPPMFAITAHASPEDRERFLADGFDDYLPKPISAQELLAKIATLGRPHDIAVAETMSGGQASPSIPQIASAHVDDVHEANRFAAALRRLEGDHEMLREQMELFIEDSPKLLAKLEDAIRDCDVPNIELLAHRLKGLAQSFDADDLTASLQAIESAAHRGDTVAGWRLDAAEQELSQLQALITRFVQGRSN